MPVQHIGELLATPRKLKKHLLIVTLVSLIIAIIAALLFDQSLSQFFGVPANNALYRPVARKLTDLGLSDAYFSLSLLTWAFFKWMAPRMKKLSLSAERMDYFRRWGLNFFAALCGSGLLTLVIKFVVGRQRPHKTPDFDPFVFKPFSVHWHWQSFSSGHSQVMFTAATMMCLAFPRQRWIWIPFALVICATRIVVHDHFLSDTIFGACVGYVGTLLSLKFMREKTKNGLF